ncbi:YD repeat-containing protein [Escherichia coli]|nr:YD repeat-containing protein [Escherichia coli]
MSGKPAARQGDMTQYGGSIVQGSAGVRIGAPTGVACSVCPGGVTSGHPVNPLLGAKVLPGETDIALPGPLPFILSRTYSSYRTKTPAPVGSLGPGWKMPADIRLQLRDNTLILSDNGGRSLYFEHLFPGEDGYGRCFADRQNLMVCLRSMPNVFTGSCARMRCCLSENLLYRHRNGHIQAEWP